MDLIKALKKMLSRQKIDQQVPESLEGEVTEDGILAKFRELYAMLYNSAGMEEEVGGLKLQLADIVLNGPSVGQIQDKVHASLRPG